MKVFVLNGSPYGTNGITAQYIQFLEKTFSEHTFETVEVARKLGKFERSPLDLEYLLQKIASADTIIWAFPVYTMLVPSQLKRFIELLFENECGHYLKDKIATGISTSANFYDHTAHDYMQGISSDLGLRYVRGFSAEMKDLLSESGRNNFLGFAKDFFWRVDQDEILQDRVIPKVSWTPPDLSALAKPEVAPKSTDKSIVIISDANPDDQNLLTMLDLFERQSPYEVELIELGSTRIKGGCIGCLKCGDGDACFYKDEYAEAFEKVKHADVVIYAGAIRDRYYSARFKKFMDRYFSNGHRQVLSAGLLGHIVSGPLEQLAGMRETLEAHIEMLHCQRLGIVSDEHPDPKVTAQNIGNMVKFLENWMSNTEWRASPTFLGVGGHKVFRDLVYENRAVMGADYKYYKDENLLDFPTASFRKRMQSRIMMTLQKIPSLRNSFKKDMNKYRIRPYKELLARTKPQEAAK